MPTHQELQTRYEAVRALAQRLKTLTCSPDSTDLSLPYQQAYEKEGLNQDLINTLLNGFPLAAFSRVSKIAQVYNQAKNSGNKSDLKVLANDLDNELAKFEQNHFKHNEKMINLVEKLHMVLDKNGDLSPQERQLKTLFQSHRDSVEIETLKKILNDDRGNLLEHKPRQITDQQRVEFTKKLHELEKIQAKTFLSQADKVLQSQNDLNQNLTQHVQKNNDKSSWASPIFWLNKAKDLFSATSETNQNFIKPQTNIPPTLSQSESSLENKVAVFAKRCASITLPEYQQNIVALSNDVRNLHQQIKGSTLSNATKYQLADKLNETTIGLANRISQEAKLKNSGTTKNNGDEAKFVPSIVEKQITSHIQQNTGATISMRHHG